MWILLAVAMGCSSAGRPQTEPEPRPAVTRPGAAPEPSGTAPAPAIGPSTIRIDASGLWFGPERIAAVQGGDVAAAARDPASPDRIPALVDRLRGASAPPSTADAGPLALRMFTSFEVSLAADRATPVRALVAVVQSAGEAGALAVNVRATDEPDQRAVRLTFPTAALSPSAPPSLLTVTGSSLFGAAAGGSIDREERAAAEPVAAAVERLVARRPALAQGAVVLAANPDVTVGTLLDAARTLQSLGATALYLSAGVR